LSERVFPCELSALQVAAMEKDVAAAAAKLINSNTLRSNT
jgi:hypothetical protein